MVEKMDKKAALLKRRVDTSTEDVVISDDLTVAVRALKRSEVDLCKDDSKEDKVLFERYLIAAGMCDPEMTRVEVVEWLDNAPAGDGVKVMDAIARLSGMDEGAPKSRVQKTSRRQRR